MTAAIANRSAPSSSKSEKSRFARAPTPVAGSDVSGVLVDCGSSVAGPAGLSGVFVAVAQVVSVPAAAMDGVQVGTSVLPNCFVGVLVAVLVAI
jgi:hypothetical protein